VISIPIITENHPQWEFINWADQQPPVRQGWTRTISVQPLFVLGRAAPIMQYHVSDQPDDNADQYTVHDD